MAYDTNPLWNRLSDTVEARAYASNRGATTVDVIGTFGSIDEISWETLPATCFLRGSQEHSTRLLRFDGQWFLYGNGDAFCDADGRFQISDRSVRFSINDTDAKTIASMWLSTSNRSYAPDMNHGFVDASIIVEPFLIDENGQQPIKYRVYCFDGVPEMIELTSPTITRLGGCALYTPEWTHVRQSVHSGIAPIFDFKRPNGLQGMIRDAMAIASGIDHICIEFIVTASGPAVHRMVGTPYRGQTGTPSRCPDVQQWLATLWNVDTTCYNHVPRQLQPELVTEQVWSVAA
ncbi:MAG: hypothetical protein ACKO14_08695 [Armatimonadota bacterium]